MSAKEYLEKFGVEGAVAKAVTQVLKDRPGTPHFTQHVSIDPCFSPQCLPVAFSADPIAAIGQILLNSTVAKTIGVGSNFPMDTIVHCGFAGNTPDAPKPMSHFLSGIKALVVSLPGAFTPT